MSDHIIRGMAANNQVRFFAGTTRDIVETARSAANHQGLCPEWQV